MERKNEVKRSLDFLRSSECYRNKILTDEKKERERNECFYKEDTMPKVPVISNPSKWRDFSLPITRMYRVMWGTDEDRNAKHICSTL